MKTTHSRLLSLAALPALLLGTAACDDDDDPVGPDQDIAAIVDATAEVSTLRTALNAANLVPALQGDGPFTVFAPRNDAFDALGSDLVDALLQPENEALLTEILTYHVVPGTAAFAEDLSDGQSIATLEGETVDIGVAGGDVTVNGANVVSADIGATNGVVHLIDAVLVPETDLVNTAILNGFGTLVDLVDQAGLVPTLRSDNGGDGFTVFAPTDDAFGELDAVPSGQALVDVLTYHVVPGTVGSGELSDGLEVTTVEGGTFTVSISGSDVTLTDEQGNTVNVVATDVSAENGVVHVIDGVILPN